MNISDVIDQLEALKDEHGDLEVFINTGDGPSVPRGISVETDDDDRYPADWNMPEEWVELTFF